jgi:hypothetical protein
MSPRSRAIVLLRRPPPSPALLVAELRLAGLVAEADGHEAALEAFGRELHAFEARYRQATGAAFAELEAAERLLRRLDRLREELRRLDTALRQPAPHRTAAAAPAPAPSLLGGGGRAGAEPADAPERPGRTGGHDRAGGAARALPGAGTDARRGPAEAELRALYRRLARALHPDLARGEAERARRQELMARANAAWARRDRTALELLADRLGSDALGIEVAEAERLAWLERRIAAVAALCGRRAAEHGRLARSAAAVLREEAARREEEGADALAEARSAAEDAAAAARAEVLDRLAPLAAAAEALGRRARGRDGSLAPALAASPALRPPADEPRLPRRPRAPARAALPPTARALAATLAERAAPAPWEVATVLLGFFAECSGRPPEALRDGTLLEERWQALRADWPGAPSLGHALASAPRALEVGLRAAAGGVQAGLQLAAPELVAGARAALEDARVRDIAGAVLAVLGPRQRCGRCGEEGYARHLLRVSGLDEVHGLACPHCGAVARSFWRYGEPEGVEALAPLARELGVVAEARVRLAGARLAFGMVPAERGALTAGALLERFRELCLAPARLELPDDALAVTRAGKVLPSTARLPSSGAFALRRAGGPGPDEGALLAELRARVASRFRAG